MADKYYRLVFEMSDGTTRETAFTVPQGEKGDPGEVSAEDIAQAVEAYMAENSVQSYNVGDGLKLDEETNTLSVDTADEVEQDNTRPITSAAVHTTVGNIEILLETI